MSTGETALVYAVLGFVVICLALLVENLVWVWLGNRFTDRTDDTMALAEAASVTPMDPALIVDWHTHGPALSDLSLATTLAGWSTAAADHPYVDHAPCEGPGCGKTICCCPFSESGLPCPGAVDQWCGHHNMLCEDCRIECTDCRQDARDDAGVA